VILTEEEAKSMRCYCFLDRFCQTRRSRPRGSGGVPPGEILTAEKSNRYRPIDIMVSFFFQKKKQKALVAATSELGDC
jgi:hypothetical protein